MTKKIKLCIYCKHFYAINRKHYCILHNIRIPDLMSYGCDKCE